MSFMMSMAIILLCASQIQCSIRKSSIRNDFMLVIVGFGRLHKAVPGSLLKITDSLFVCAFN